jgi:RluA family pseudouridine synthase
VVQEITVPAGYDGEELEAYLARRFPPGYVGKLFRKNGIRLNGRRAKKRDPIHSGDRVELSFPLGSTAAATKPHSRRAEIDVLFENSDLLVINKPAGIAVHEAKNIAKNRTILGLLEARFQQTPVQPLLVHRLDKDTSGALLVAKNQQTAGELEHQFKKAAVKKQYLCLVAGRLPQPNGIIDLRLPGREGKAVRAITRYKVEKLFFDATLVQVTIETGRMHQIRLHFAKLGYPVVMDRQHGDFAFNRSFRRRTALNRQFLHAARLALSFRGQYFSWQAPLPQDLRRTLQILESESR